MSKDVSDPSLRPLRIGTMSPRSWHKYDAVSPVDAPGTTRPKDDLYHPGLVQTAETWNFDASTKRVNSVSPDAYGKEREVSTNAGGPEPTIGWMSTALLVGLYFIGKRAYNKIYKNVQMDSSKLC
jgi:hypothetical protein